MASAALGDQVAEPVLLDLAAGGHGELRHDLEALRELLARQLVPLQERHDLAERDRLPFPRDHHRAGPLPQPRVGHRHDRDAGDLRMSVEQVLDLHDRDVLASADDEVLRSPGDGEVALRVEGAPVAGLEPAIGGVPVRGELRPLEVADELGRAAHQQVALDARRGPARRRRPPTRSSIPGSGAPSLPNTFSSGSRSPLQVARPFSVMPQPAEMAQPSRARASRTSGRGIGRARRDEQAERAHVALGRGVGEVPQERRGPHGERHALGLDQPRRLLGAPHVQPDRGGAEQQGQAVAEEIAGLVAERRGHQHHVAVRELEPLDRAIEGGERGVLRCASRPWARRWCRR